MAKPKVLCAYELAGSGSAHVCFTRDCPPALYLVDGQQAKWFDIFGRERTVEEEPKTRARFTFRHTGNEADSSVVTSWPMVWVAGRACGGRRELACAPTTQGATAFQVLGSEAETL